MSKYVTVLFLGFYKTLPKNERQPRVPSELRSPSKPELKSESKRSRNPKGISEPATARQPLYVSEPFVTRQPFQASAILLQFLARNCYKFDVAFITIKATKG